MGGYKVVALVCVALILLSLMGIVALSQLKSHTIPGSGNIVASQEMVANPSFIDWGIIELGVPVERSVDLTNVGTVALANLHMEINNVVGLVSFTVTWNGETVSIQPTTTFTAVFVLTVSSASGTDFSFDIVLSWT